MNKKTLAALKKHNVPGANLLAPDRLNVENISRPDGWEHAVAERRKSQFAGGAKHLSG